MVFIDGPVPRKIAERDSSTPILARPINSKVSPLEVIGSMAGKVGKRIDEGIIGNFVRGYLVEQVLSTFGKSGYNFNTKYVENDAMHTNPGRKCYRESSSFGFLAGVLQDATTALGLYVYLNGHDSVFSESCTALIGLKVATQLGAYAKRRYDAEKESLRLKKLNSLNKKPVDKGYLEY